MRIRHDAVCVSSVLFTIALLCLLPAFFAAALSGRDRMALYELGAGYQAAAQAMGDAGVASLAIVFIGLLVTWTGYIKSVRSTWFVMFIIVSVWAFPILVLPLLQHTIALTFSQWMSNAWREPGPPRDWAENIALFSLMVVALVLPVKSFLLTNKPAAMEAEMPKPPR